MNAAHARVEQQATLGPVFHMCQHIAAAAAPAAPQLKLVAMLRALEGGHALWTNIDLQQELRVGQPVNDKLAPAATCVTHASSLQDTPAQSNFPSSLSPPACCCLNPLPQPAGRQRQSQAALASGRLLGRRSRLQRKH